MPGLTEKILMKEAAQVSGVFIHGQMVNLTSDQWRSLRLRCEKVLDLPPDWDDLHFNQTVRQMKDQGWGSLYGPDGSARYKVRTRDKPKELEAKRKEPVMVDTNQGALW